MSDRLGPNHPNWQGGRKVAADGHVLLYAPSHARASKRYVYEHVLIAEAVLGHALPVGAVVHHVNEVKGDNRNANLAMLQDQGEHQALHLRLRRLRAGFDPWRARPKAQRRYATCRSEYHPHSTLTDDNVRAIRAAVAAGQKQTDVAAQFAVSKFVINDIVRGRKYKAVSEAA